MNTDSTNQKFINLTNHPSDTWGEQQLEAARKYGEMVDMPFPQVDPEMTTQQVKAIALEQVHRIMEQGSVSNLTVHVMGEMTLVYHIVDLLKRRGVRCVASTTKRIVNTNADGKTESVFRFVNFRDYTRVSLWHQFLSAKWCSRKWPQLLEKKDFYSVIALLLLLATYICSGLGLNVGGPAEDVSRPVEWNTWWLVVFILIGLLLVLWCVSKGHGVKLSLRSDILTRLLASTIAPRGLAVIYLFMFVVHIGWFADSIFNLFTRQVYLWPLFPLFVIGLITLVVFFPDGRKSKKGTATKVFISGISLPLPPKEDNYENLNLLPLVRVLHEAGDDKCGLLILLSDFDGDEAKASSGVKEVLRFLRNKCHCDAIDNVDDISNLPIEDQLRMVIREVAKHELPDKAQMINDMSIQFTEPCSYHKFSECFSVLSKKVKELDDDEHMLKFNLTPGTGVVGSVMTLMAIDSDRDLYHYSQAKGLQNDRRLTLVDKSSVPLRNLLSQALENIENND